MRRWQSGHWMSDILFAIVAIELADPALDMLFAKVPLVWNETLEQSGDALCEMLDPIRAKTDSPEAGDGVSVPSCPMDERDTELTLKSNGVGVESNTLTM